MARGTRTTMRIPQTITSKSWRGGQVRVLRMELGSPIESGSSGSGITPPARSQLPDESHPSRPTPTSRSSCQLETNSLSGINYHASQRACQRARLHLDRWPAREHFTEKSHRPADSRLERRPIQTIDVDGNRFCSSASVIEHTN